MKLPGEIWALGFVSLLMDVASETIHGLLPVFLVTALGATVTSVGLWNKSFLDFFRHRALALLLASSVAGFLWDSLGSQATFLASAGFSFLGFVLFLGSTSLFSRHLKDT